MKKTNRVWITGRVRDMTFDEWLNYIIGTAVVTAAGFILVGTLIILFS